MNVCGSCGQFPNIKNSKPELTEEPLEAVRDQGIVVSDTVHHRTKALHTTMDQLHTDMHK